MIITIEYFGQLTEITGKKKESIEFDSNVLLKELMRSLASNYGEDFKNIAFNEQGEIHPTILILINEVMADKENDVVIEDGGTIKLLTAIAGG